MKENGLYGTHHPGCMERTPNCLCNRCIHDDDRCCIEHDKRYDDNGHEDCPDFEPDTDTTMIEKQEELK